MTLSDKALDYLEEQIPTLLAEMALQKAYWQTLASGDSVLIADNGHIVEVRPDGTLTVVKAISKAQTIQQRHFPFLAYDSTPADVCRAKRFRESSVKAEIADGMLGVYLNPDEIEKEVSRNDYYDIRD